MKIFLVRHGEAAASWDQDRDPGLSALGLEQARQAANNLAPQLAAKTCIVSSPLKRAQETAAPLSEMLSAKVIIEDAFREVPSPASLTNRRVWLQEMMRRRWPEQPNELHQWRDEILNALLSLEQNTVVFTHFMVINAVIGELTDCEETVCFHPDYVSVTHLESIEGNLSLVDAGAEMQTLVN